MRGLAGLAVILLAWFAISLVVGVIKAAVSLALLLAVGYLVWRVLQAVLR